MHKRFVNQCTIEVVLIPKGPLLIKSGKEGADPTKPDMEFVETYHKGMRSLFLPGSSLKGAIRAHAERIVRTVGQSSQPSNPDQLWASDPLEPRIYEYLEKLTDPKQVYHQSSFTDQMFGSTSISSRIRIEDAYPPEGSTLRIEERNGVAIDRVFGSVAVGPFNYQVCTEGEFQTRIHLKNFTLAQLGLIGLVLRDLNEGWFGLGFAKSRGMGSTEVSLRSATVRYPSCLLDENSGQIKALGSNRSWSPNLLLGAGEFLNSAERQAYGFPETDHQTADVEAQSMDLGVGVSLTWTGDGVHDLFKLGVRSWSRLLQGVSV